MLGKIFYFFFSIALSNYLITSPDQKVSNKNISQQYQSLLTYSKQLANEIENLEKIHVMRNAENLMKMANSTDANRNMTLKTPVSVLQELLAKWKKTPTYNCSLDYEKGFYQCSVSFDDKSGQKLNGKYRIINYIELLFCKL